MKSFLDLQLEVLSKDADAGTWIDDFVKSDNPKFAGKSKEKRKQMALAAYYAAQKNEGVKQVRGDDSLQYEEVELDEISKEVAGKYLDKVTKDQIKTQGHQSNMYDKLPANRQKGVDNAFKRLKEETLDEASRAETGELFKSLVNKAHASSEAGNHTQAKRHLANAQTARYGILAKHMPKHQASFDKYKELKHSYTNSDEPVREETELDEAIQSHKVGVTVSDPNHQAVSQRKEKMQKSVIVKATDKGEAQAKAEAFYKKKGYKVHDSFHHSVVPATSMKTEAYKLPSDSDIDKVKAHVKANHPNKSLAQVAVHKQTKKIEYVVKDKDGKMSGHTLGEEAEQIKETLKGPYHTSVENGVFKQAHGKNYLHDKDQKAYGSGDKLTNDPRIATFDKETHAQKAAKQHGGTVTKMGLGTYRVVKEESLDELSNKLLNRYSKKAEKEAGKHFMAADRAQDRGNYDKAQTNMDKAEKRASGVYRAQSKIKEESLDEISKDTLSSYAHKAFAQGNDLHYDLAHSRGDKATDAERQAIKDKISKRNAGVIKAAQKMNKEDMDEAVDTVKKDASGKVIAWSHEGDWEKSSTKNGGARGRGKVANLSDVARRKSEKLAKEEAVDESKQTYEEYLKDCKVQGRTPVSKDKWQWSQNRFKEEVELDEKAAAGPWHVHDSKTDKIHSTYSTHKKAINAMNKLNDQHDGYETPGGIIQSKFKATAASYHKEEVELDEASIKLFMGKYQVWHKGQKVAAYNSKTDAQDHANSLKEEVEELDELSKGTLKSYVGKAVQSHGSNRVIANMAWDKSEKPGDLLDKLGHKALKDSKKRSIGIAKAVDKLTKEEVEEFMQTEAYDQLDELDKKTLGNYVKKAHDQLRQHSGTTATKYARGDKDAISYALGHARKALNRDIGITRAVDKLTKEDVEPMLTYSEFMAQLAEGKADDLRDKLAADRERRMDKYDYSKEKDTKASPVKNVKGHSYGAGEDSEEGEDEVKTAKPAAVKRGRGRPAGSKSGARV